MEPGFESPYRYQNSYQPAWAPVSYFEPNWITRINTSSVEVAQPRTDFATISRSQVLVKTSAGATFYTVDVGLTDARLERYPGLGTKIGAVLGPDRVAPLRQGRQAFSAKTEKLLDTFCRAQSADVTSSTTMA